MSGAKLYTVSRDEGEQRLDRWLRRRFPGLPQGRIEKWCRTGQLRVDGRRAKASTRLAPGQVVRVPPVVVTPGAPSPRPELHPEEVQLIRRAVLYRDDHIIVINKPPGLASQGGSGQGARHVDALAEALRFGRDEKPRLVHRLDKDTSGVMVLARSARIARRLGELLRSRRARKIYWAAVVGLPEPRMGTIRFGLVKQQGRGGEGERMHWIHPDRVEATPGAKHAVSDYAVLDHLGRRVSWVALVPVTGRTHQLRAHMAAIGHPIVGDGKYGHDFASRGSGWDVGLGPDLAGRLHLHARALMLDHPVSGRPMTFVAPLPEHMQRTWQTFEWQPEAVPLDPFREPA